MATKTKPKSEDTDDNRSVFSDLIFMVSDAPTTPKAYLASTARVTAIPEDPTSKDIFSAVFDWIQVSSTTAQRSIYSITNEITNSQVAMLSQKGANIID